MARANHHLSGSIQHESYASFSVALAIASAQQPQVHLGYSTYQGYTNATSKLSVFNGIRYAAPPIGALRWVAPQAPIVNNASIIDATRPGAQCPQNRNAPNPADLSDPEDGSGSEDCLFLNVYAPDDAKKLPVLVWIHGGGYGAGNGRQDFTQIINSNNNSFVGVAIQYRLGAFGFASSDEIFRNGVANAGIYDQLFALQWVQDHISKFGGDSSRVTISGESAGGGSAMLLDMAWGGTLGNKLFTNTIAASPYLPMQYGYKDWVPSQSYYSFAARAGCFPFTAYGSSNTTVLECLRSKDSATLISASQNISKSGTYGTWGFLPVTDGKAIQQLPSIQLQSKVLNGQRLLVGNNANEGPGFTPQSITTEDDLVAWLNLTFPLFTNDDISKILQHYPTNNAPVDSSAPLFATLGDTGPTALNQSSFGTGQQQRANNIYAETTFVCPSYWMAEAYSGKTGFSSYKYQFSVPISIHGQDVSGYFGPAAPEQGPDFEYAFMKIWGNFITTNNPSISDKIANGGSSNSTANNPAIFWPSFNVTMPYQLNLNQSGGVPLSVSLNSVVNATELVGPTLRNDFRLVNAYTWEGGRGARCNFWRDVGVAVPE
ncbi:hypothetical protein Vi05172_g12079 [Venturia inaequalis]|nr:hypothetical protein Vi05172_g12079 [Venturia inaequalis]